MSDILIKGMKMPKSCPCELVGIGYDRYCGFTFGIPARVKQYGECCERRTKPDWCPLVPVPPHGKLIDADVLDILCKREQQAWQDYEHDPDNEYLEGVKDGLHEAAKCLSTASTII